MPTEARCAESRVVGRTICGRRLGNWPQLFEEIGNINIARQSVNLAQRDFDAAWHPSLHRLVLSSIQFAQFRYHLREMVRPKEPERAPAPNAADGGTS
jgi:hypothetical protein